MPRACGATEAPTTAVGTAGGRYFIIRDAMPVIPRRPEGPAGVRFSRLAPLPGIDSNAPGSRGVDNSFPRERLTGEHVNSPRSDGQRWRFRVDRPCQDRVEVPHIDAPDPPALWTTRFS
jgi:hypothetical protein